MEVKHSLLYYVLLILCINKIICYYFHFYPIHVLAQINIFWLGTLAVIIYPIISLLLSLMFCCSGKYISNLDIHSLAHIASYCFYNCLMCILSSYCSLLSKINCVSELPCLASQLHTPCHSYSTIMLWKWEGRVHNRIDWLLPHMMYPTWLKPVVPWWCKWRDPVFLINNSIGWL